MPVNRLHMYQVHGGIEGENAEYDQERGAFSETTGLRVLSFCPVMKGGRLFFLSDLGRYVGFCFFREFHVPKMLAENR